MAVRIMENSGQAQYGLKTYVVDTDSDLLDLPVNDPVGSTALVIDTSSVYMLNSEGEWKEL